MLRATFCWVLVILYFQDSFSEVVTYTRSLNVNIETACACGQAAPARTKRIINGKTATSHAYPWVVPIFINGEFQRAGSLINDRYVLTAAEGIQSSFKDAIEVGLGKHDSDRNEGNIRKIKRIILHPKYSVSKGPVGLHTYNDIALFELEEPVTVGEMDNVGQVCLPFDMERSAFYNNEAKIAGWGYTVENGAKATYLREADVKVLSTDACVERFPPNGFVDQNEICALGAKNEDICRKDDGGPLFTKLLGSHVLIGIISKGHFCTGLGAPFIYTSVAEFMDWIIAETQNAVYCA